MKLGWQNREIGCDFFQCFGMGNFQKNVGEEFKFGEGFVGHFRSYGGMIR